MYTYDANSRLIAVQNPAGDSRQYGYDSNGLLTSVVNERTVTIATNTYNSAGLVQQQTQPDGGVWQFAYTPFNPTVPGISGGASVPSGASVFLTPGPIISQNLKTVVTDPLGHATTYRFDGNGFTQSVTDPLGQVRTLSRDKGNLKVGENGKGACDICGPTDAGDLVYTYL